MPQRDVGKDGVLGTVAAGEVTPNEEGPGDSQEAATCLWHSECRGPGALERDQEAEEPSAQKVRGETGLPDGPGRLSQRCRRWGAVLGAQPRRQGQQSETVRLLCELHATLVLPTPADDAGSIAQEGPPRCTRGTPETAGWGAEG